MADDASLVADVGDTQDVLPGLNGIGDVLRAQMLYHLRRQFDLEWHRRLERCDEWRVFSGLSSMLVLECRAKRDSVRRVLTAGNGSTKPFPNVAQDFLSEEAFAAEPPVRVAQAIPLSHSVRARSNQIKEAFTP